MKPIKMKSGTTTAAAVTETITKARINKNDKVYNPRAHFK